MLSTYSSNLHFCRVVGLLSLVGGLATCYILATALNSPDELWGTGGGVLTVFGWVFVGALFSYVKVNFKIYIQLFFCRSLCFFFISHFFSHSLAHSLPSPLQNSLLQTRLSLSGHKLIAIYYLGVYCWDVSGGWGAVLLRGGHTAGLGRRCHDRFHSSHTGNFADNSKRPVDADHIDGPYDQGRL